MVIVIICFTALCSSIFFSLFKREGILISNVINLITISILSVYTLFLNEINIANVITVAYPDNIIISLVGFFIVLLTLYEKPSSWRESQVSGLYFFVFLVSYVLFGLEDWINVFICYKIVVLAYYSLLSERKDKSSKNLFIFEMLRSIVLMMAIVFYFLGTQSFIFYQPNIVNQDFFLVSLVLFALFTAMELGLFPFHFWFEELLKKKKGEKQTFYVFVRKIIFSYFMIVTLKSLSLACDSSSGEIFLSIIKIYVLINIVAGSFFLLVQKNVVEIVSSFAMLNMGLAYLCIILRGSKPFKEYLAFYLFCTLVPLLGISLANGIVCIQEKGECSMKRFCSLITNNFWLGTFFVVFLLTLAGFPLTVGFPSKLLLSLGLFEMGGNELLVGLVFMFFFPMQASFKIIGYMFSEPREKIKTISLGRRHLWTYAVLAFLMVVGGVSPPLFLITHK